MSTAIVYAWHEWNGGTPGPNLPAAYPSWNADSLRSWLETTYRGVSIVVLSNRAPFRHARMPDGRVAVRRSFGGLVTALEPLLTSCDGVWVAMGDEADRTTDDGRAEVDLLPGDVRCRLRRVWLSRAEERGYYDGFCNQGLWPLCHRVDVAPIFRAHDFACYRAANARFADAVCAAVRDRAPVVLVQDYHFALVPRLIRTRIPDATVAAFWHVPFPPPQVLADCPWRDQLLEGLLASSIVGFQTRTDRRNFLNAAARTPGAKVDVERNVIVHEGHQIQARVYPASVEYPSRWVQQLPAVDVCRRSVRRQLGLALDTMMAVGIDRLDYTKGIVEKFLAVERLLESHPEWRERFVLVQIAEPSRAHLPEYREERRRLLATEDHVNNRFGSSRYRPLLVLEQPVDRADVFAYLRAADVCYVGSLHDGMNLVAKEFVAARDDERGVLILSQFAGAARELSAALHVNPYATDHCARSLATALSMPPEEQRVRMKAMRAVVEEFNSHRWAAAMLGDTARSRVERSAVSLV